MMMMMRAEFVRLKKTGFFWLCMAVSAAMALGLLLVRFTDGLMHPEYYTARYDDVVFVSGMFLIFVMAAFTGLFVGTEFSDGTIRNKLIVGHKRRHLYLTEAIVCGVGNVLISLAYIVAILVFGNLLIGPSGLKTELIVSLTLATIIASLAMSAILTAVAMLFASKAAGSVACLLLTGVLFFVSFYIYGRLQEPEFYPSAVSMDEETGEMITRHDVPNPDYVRGTKRKVYETLDTALPTSQFNQIAELRMNNPLASALWDLGFVLAFTVGGIVLFRKKDLK